MIVLHPQYEHLRDWVTHLPDTFATQGDIIYDARNQIRVIEGPDHQRYNVKRYCIPKWYNRLVYTFFRKPKAVRAYTNALLLNERGIATPTAIAYILCGKGLLAESYLITQQIDYTHCLYEWGDGLTDGREEAMRAFGRFTANMHQQQICHLDYSPGNILYHQIDGIWQFFVVDINRMRIGPVSITQGCANMGRLWGEEAVYHCIAEGYAAARHIDVEDCFLQMWQAHQAFWHKRKKPIEYQSKVI